MPHDYLSSSSSSPQHGSGTVDRGIVPGKRSLTQSLAPKAPSLRDQQRAVVDFDAAAGDDFYDQRATVDAPASTVPLTDRQIRKAQRKNPRWVAKTKVSAQIFSNADVDSAAFALDVAEKQAANGLVVDGIAGPKTVAAIAGQVAAARSVPPRGAHRASAEAAGPRDVVDFDDGTGDDFYDSRATVEHDSTSERFAHDDPFGMHLIGAT